MMTDVLKTVTGKFVDVFYKGFDRRLLRSCAGIRLFFIWQLGMGAVAERRVFGVLAGA